LVKVNEEEEALVFLKKLTEKVLSEDSAKHLKRSIKSFHDKKT